MTIPRKEYDATLVAYTQRTVVCESCNAEYVYAMKCEGMGSATSVLFLDNQGAAQRAEESAAKNLQTQLESAVDGVPCPTCGWYQASMVAHIRKEWGVWGIVGGIVGAVIGGLLVFYSLIVGFVIWRSGPTPGGATLSQTITMGTCGAAVIAVSAAVFFVRARLAASYEPNDAPAEERIQRGQRRAALAGDCTPERIDELYRAAAAD